MADQNLKENIDKLIKLQQVDSEIFDIRFEKEKYPKRLSEIDVVLETKKAGMEEAEERLKKLQVDKNELENDLQTGEDKIKKHEGELALIKTNKEYTAMLEQIESIKADISKIEEKTLSLFDEIEQAQAGFEEEKNKFEEERGKAESEKNVIKAEEKKLDESLLSLLQKRQDLLSGVDEKLLARYEQILKSRGRNALSKIVDNVCQECNMQLRPQVINEARLLRNLTTCENCSRILFSEE